MPNKIFWFDVETSGLSEYKNCILSLACIIEIDGKIVDKSDYRLRPHKAAEIDPKALAVNGFTPECIATFPDQFDTFRDLMDTLESHVDKYDKLDKFVLAGYNVPFDERFLRQFFLLNGQRYFGSYFTYPKINVPDLLVPLWLSGELKTPDFKLSTICSHFGIELNAHDAMSDIMATRELYYRLLA